MAIELALNPPGSTSADKLRLLLLTMVAALLVIVFFPFYRFFKPTPRDLGAMSIGGPTMEEAATPANVRNKPWLGVLIKIDRLYFREGKLTEAITEMGQGNLNKRVYAIQMTRLDYLPRVSTPCSLISIRLQLPEKS